MPLSAQPVKVFRDPREVHAAQVDPSATGGLHGRTAGVREWTVPKRQSTAAKNARRRQATNNTRYMHELRRHTPDAQPVPVAAKAYLAEVVRHLAALGWGAGDDIALQYGRYETHHGAAFLRTGRDVPDHLDEADPDDPQVVDLTAPVHLVASAPPGDCYEDDFMFGAVADAKPPSVVAAELDAELGRVRLRRVRGVEPESTTPCPICGDRYPAEHLLPNCDQGTPMCPACIFDGDQTHMTDLPYLALALDELLDNDLAAPAGWSGVATLLGLVCGTRLGRRLERELGTRRAFPVAADRWHDTRGRGWIWLPPPADRHEAFRSLGAGATVEALTQALVGHVPTLLDQAKAVVRDAEVVWRPSLLPAAVAYAVAFSTQAHERDRHRKPVHVVDSISDGLSLIFKPFGVTGDSINVECGLQALLEDLLFPLLLGHGLRNQPVEPRRNYGAADDDRPVRTRCDARLSYGIDRATQIAIVLGKNLMGLPVTSVPWDGEADSTLDLATLGTTAPVDDRIAGVRDQFRLHAAGAAFDDGGPLTMTADHAWTAHGAWIPADTAAHAVRQARDYLLPDLRIEVLWAGPMGSWPEPLWVCVDIVEVNSHSTGPDNSPWIRVWDGQSLFGMRLADIGAVLRGTSITPLTPVHRT